VLDSLLQEIMQEFIEINNAFCLKEPVNHLEIEQPQYKCFPQLNHHCSYSDFFDQYLMKNQPCIFSCELTQNWRSVKDWAKEGSPNLNFLKDLVDNDSIVPVSNCNKKYFNSQECSEETFGSYVDYWDNYERGSEPCKYLKDFHFHRDWHHLYLAYRTPLFFCSDWLNEWWENRRDSDEANDYRFVYVGPKGSWTPLHSDVFGSYSWSANIVGSKKWIFFPPGEEKKLKDNLGNLVYDVELCDGKYIEKFEIIQNTGEVVFVPSGWHHQVKNLEDTISINHNWFNGCNILSVFYLLREELRKVEKEIHDCKDQGDDWTEMCQSLLRASYGMNYHDFLALLTFILQRRISMLVDEDCKIKFDDHYLGVNHARFDIARINLVLGHFAQEFANLEMNNDYVKCIEYIEKCAQYVE